MSNKRLLKQEKIIGAGHGNEISVIITYYFQKYFSSNVRYIHLIFELKVINLTILNACM